MRRQVAARYNNMHLRVCAASAVFAICTREGGRGGGAVVVQRDDGGAHVSLKFFQPHLVPIFIYKLLVSSGF